MFTKLQTENKARLGHVTTSDGSFITPCFMNVATSAAIKGGLSTIDLEKVGCQVMLSNTYHLHIRPGDELIGSMGGLKVFSRWSKPLLTDSGGFQVFSHTALNKVNDEAVVFRSHVDGRKMLFTPELSMQIQANLASSIAMALDECINSKAELGYVKEASERTIRWLVRCKDELARIKQNDKTINKEQQLFGINQGACNESIRIDNMKRIAELDLDGYAIGGLAVGETHEEMYSIVSIVEEHMPQDKARYLMGVGTPGNILEAVARGIDMFDCVLPARNGRHGHFFTYDGIINILNSKYVSDSRPIDETCSCEVCRNYSRSYIRHLFIAKEVLALRFGAYHNLYFYNNLMKRIQNAIKEGEFTALHRNYKDLLDQRI